MNLAEFIQRVDARIDQAVVHPQFDPDQQGLLGETVTRYRPFSRMCPIFDPLSRAILYFIVKAWDRPIDEQVEQLATFCSMYLLAADLIDDVQDEDLAGKPHERVGPGVATNNGLALLFLALDALQSAIELEPSESRRFAFQRVFNRASIIAVAGQHRDLTDRRSISTPDDVLRMNQAKTSSLSMITECAAMLARLEEDKRARYRQVGECFASLVQIRDDLRDVFGTQRGPDLSLGRITYPVACFLSRVDDSQKRKFDLLVAQLPGSMAEIRALLYEHGAIDDCANAMEGFREQIHHFIAQMDNDSAAHRCLLWIVDGLAESIYAVPSIPISKRILEPSGPWHDLVHREFEIAWARVGSVSAIASSNVSAIASPAVRPWHLPQWTYLPKQHVIYYPDIAGLAEEILPFQAQLLGTRDLDEVAALMRALAPAVVAHELFHCLRHATGAMTDDHWHEEWAANRLAVAYLQRFAPDVLDSSLQLAQQILLRYPELLDEHAKSTLIRCNDYQPDAAGYGMDITSMSIVSLEMVRRLAMKRIDWESSVVELLGSIHCTSITAAAE